MHKKYPTTFVPLRSRGGIVEKVDVWKKTTRLKLKTLWRHIIKLSRMTSDNQVVAVRLSLLHQVSKASKITKLCNSGFFWIRQNERFEIYLSKNSQSLLFSNFQRHL